MISIEFIWDPGKKNTNIKKWKATKKEAKQYWEFIK